MTHPAPLSQLFSSFWLAGYESACHINTAGVRLDMLASTQHDRQAAHDYALLRIVGIGAARDGVRWPRIERGGRFEFSSLVPMVDAARDAGTQVLWTLCHYGWPDDLDVFAPAFVDRFARFAGAAARVIADRTDAVPFYTPINEISFLAWAAGDAGLIYPRARGRGAELKRHLVRAAIAGIEAIRAVDRRARIVHVDPVIHVVPPRDRPDLAPAAAAQRESQFEAWDMLAGRAHRDLGGDPGYLDVMGVNFYHANEWEYPDRRLRWEDSPRDDRWAPLHRLLAEVYVRYRRPLFVSETSHVGAGRAPWLREIAGEMLEAHRVGVPIEGVCIYPVLDRTDWEDPTRWHNSGLWDLVPDGRGELERMLNREYAGELRRAQARLADVGWGARPAPAVPESVDGAAAEDA